MKFCSVHILFFIIGTAALHAQIPEKVKTDSLTVSGADSLLAAEPDTLRQDSVKTLQREEKVIKRVQPWQPEQFLQAETVAADSLLRWEYLPQWGSFYAYRRDAVAYRLGTAGRNDAFTINGYGSGEQSLYFGDIKLDNPVTGFANYNLVPANKIQKVTEQYSSRLTSHIEPTNYYITSPVSYLNYDEGGEGFRNLEFMVSQNTAPGTNIELSYTDSREKGTFERSEVEGSRIYAKMYHHLGSRYQFRAAMLRTQFSNEEPFGYQITDMNLYDFDPYATSAVSSSGVSKMTRNDLTAGIFERADTLGAETGGFLISRTADSYNLKSSADTVFWDVREYRSALYKTLQYNNLILKGKAGGYISGLRDSSSVEKAGWAGFTAAADAGFVPGEGFSVTAGAALAGRNDGFYGHSLSAGLSFSSKILRVALTAAAEDKMPEIQTLYWKSNDYTGNPGLTNAQSFTFYGTMKVNLGKFWQAGGSIRYKNIRNGILLTSGNTFANGEAAALLNSTVFGRIETPRFELESSVNTEYALSQQLPPGTELLNIRDTKIWLRNSAFLKGYVFDRAAFVKGGLRTVFSPVSYQSQYYNTALNFWQYSQAGAEIPAFFRMDAELSARVRGIMVLIRWENILDDVGQAGYFETASYPMWPRRLLVGIRAKFRN